MSAGPQDAPSRYITDPPSEPSEHDPTPGPDGPDQVVPGGSPSFGGGSLAERAAARRNALENEQTVTIDIPGYEGILAAEFRLLTWTEGRRIGRENAEEPDEALQMLYTSADCILAALDRFFEVDGDKETPVETTWQNLCAGVGIPLLPGATDRVALIALLDDIGVMSLWSEYEAWRVTRGRRIAAAVVRDFEKTR